MYTPKISTGRSELYRERTNPAGRQASTEADKVTSIASAALSQDGGGEIQHSPSAADHPKSKADTVAGRGKEYRARKKIAAQQSSTTAVNSVVMLDEVLVKSSFHIVLNDIGASEEANPLLDFLEETLLL